MLVITQIIEYDEKRLIVAGRMHDSQCDLFIDDEHKIVEVLLVEMMGQTAECLYRIAKRDRKSRGFLVRLDQVKFTRRVFRNETVITEAELTKVFGKYVSAKCRSYVDGGLIASADITHYYT
ncbi:MAG: hypothetical protein GX680_09380 [Bacteroidales bacterium]|nr:hypothetical protein [Bacteroidales bacterium]